ncbi:MAG: TerC family protein [Planctomycetes bacterium]|nr:TerC family protein [Planctomycetota bacterium]
MILFLWIGFLALILAILLFDLLVVNKDAHVIPMRTALGWTCFYAALAVAFGGVVYLLVANSWAGAGTDFAVGLSARDAAVQYLTAWVLEQSLSLDNVFVIALVFAYFGVPLSLQHRVLFWGILGVLVMRGVMIGLGAVLIARFDWIIYVFGALLILTAIKLLFAGDSAPDPGKNPLVRLFRRVFPVTDGFRGARFFVVENRKRAITPLFLALLVVESTDLLFAVDSIPAVFGVTKDPFLVFTSNIFAILGLRSLYFTLAGLMERFRHVKMALVFILFFVGVKMLLSHTFHLPDLVSLGIIAGALTLGVLFSLRQPAAPPAP